MSNYGCRTRSLSIALPTEEFARLERQARASGRSPALLARELCAQGLAPTDGGRRVVVEMEPAELAAAERLARGYGLDLPGLFAAMARGLREVPGFVAGHLLRQEGRGAGEFRAGQGTGPAARG